MASQSSLADSARKLSGGTWIRKTKGLKYRKANGRFVKDAWISVSGSVYRIGEDRFAETGWFTYGDRKYYADDEGRVYYEKWLTLKKRTCYFLASGECAANQWLKLGGNYFYFNKNGKLMTNCFVGDYYVDASGIRLSSTWVQREGKRYYLDSSGKLVKNEWIKKGGKYYYMLSDGSMAVNRQIGEYYVGEDGARVETPVNGEKPFSGKYIFVGDSRMVGMSQSVSGSNTIFIAQTSSGYEWLHTTADARLRSQLAKYPDAKVVLSHGINDLGNISRYIAYYRKLISGYPKASFYVLSVNPIDYEKAKANGFRWATTDLIKSFNQSLKAAFGSRYKDTYTYLETEGFQTSDGIHYLASTYRSLYSRIIALIG